MERDSSLLPEIVGACRDSWVAHVATHGSRMSRLKTVAPAVGFEPTTKRLTVGARVSGGARSVPIRAHCSSTFVPFRLTRREGPVGITERWTGKAWVNTAPGNAEDHVRPPEAAQADSGAALQSTRSDPAPSCASCGRPPPRPPWPPCHRAARTPADARTLARVEVPDPIPAKGRIALTSATVETVTLP